MYLSLASTLMVWLKDRIGDTHNFTPVQTQTFGCKGTIRIAWYDTNDLKTHKIDQPKQIEDRRPSCMETARTTPFMFWSGVLETNQIVC